METITIFNIGATISTIVLSIISIIIAIKSSHQTSQKATQQIESIKQLSKLQIETAIKQLEIEIQKNYFLAQQAKEEWEDDEKQNSFAYHMSSGVQNMVIQTDKKSKPKKDYNFYTNHTQYLLNICQQLDELKQRLN